VIWKLIRKPLAIVLAILLVAMAITAVPILIGVKSQPAVSCDYLIVLGAGVEGDTPSPILQDRIEMAYAYLTEHPDTICIATGGKGDDENIAEAQCIFNHLTAMGIGEDRIWMEDQATSTVENFQYSIALLEEETGSVPESVGVLSNEFHLFRASLMAKKQGLKPIFVAAPTSNTGVRIGYTIREIFVLWNYLIFGG
jgi:uncharacterized SAM-binding protein YcdF (DUF218 family)